MWEGEYEVGNMWSGEGGEDGYEEDREGEDQRKKTERDEMK